MFYQTMIRDEAARMGFIGKVDPRHVEAWMRLEWGTLDARPMDDFRRYITDTIAIEHAEPGSSESLALSYGL